MIYKITGHLAEKNPTSLVIDVNGVAYEVSVPLSTYDAVGKLNDEISLYTVLIMREDDLQLYGFATQNERKLFKLLISVSGIGPRTALSLLSSAAVADVYDFIANSNSQALMSIPGIGRKTAERVILELRDKILRVGMDVEGKYEGKDEIRSEAVEALIALGYSRMQCERAIREVLKRDSASGKSVEELVRAALREVK
ncbi:MAG: Holliday junction branch migration protein RuvA [Bacteroidetes bacterium]|nr:Holliday junction branch migration protein RuvA [Bacteroidota bacterium]MCL5738090.1 Holliday junction branch migration protein RuvA [Bacteroidota bacterium]